MIISIEGNIGSGKKNFCMSKDGNYLAIGHYFSTAPASFGKVKI